MNEIQITIDKNVFDNFNQFKSANILRILKDVELTEEQLKQITNFLNVDVCYFQFKYCPKGTAVEVINWDKLVEALQEDEEVEAKVEVVEDTKIDPIHTKYNKDKYIKEE